MASDRDIVARHVGRRIRELREAAGIDPGRLAAHLDLSLEELARFERGEERIAPNLLVAAGRLGGVGIDWFFRGAPPPERDAAEPPDDLIAARFLALPEAPPLMRAFVAIPARESRLVVVDFARMAGSAGG